MTSIIASFDIGKKNFAFIVEKVDTEKLKNIENVPVTKRYKKDGTPTEKFQMLLNSLYDCGEVILLRNLDITEGCDPKKYFDPRLFYNMTDVLDEYIEFWDRCDAFIVEQQMSFGRRKNNSMAVKLGQHCQSYFILNFHRFKKTLEFPAYHKTQILGAPKAERKTKPGRKKWAIKEAMNILNLRKDDDTLAQVTTKKKQDDMSDCLLMTISYSYLHFIEKKI